MSRQMRSASARRLLSSMADRPCRSAIVVLTGDRSILGYGEMWPMGSALRWIIDRTRALHARTARSPQALVYKREVGTLAFSPKRGWPPRRAPAHPPFLSTLRSGVGEAHIGARTFENSRNVGGGGGGDGSGM